VSALFDWLRDLLAMRPEITSAEQEAFDRHKAERAERSAWWRVV
jgi:hypothetical protein